MFEKPLFTKDQEQRIVAAIKEAELNTSGEIRIHVEKHCKDDAYTRAIQVFEKLGMTNTDLRNGVLVYLAMHDHKFAIIGDEGINNKVPENFWETTKDLMREHFKQGNLAEGVIEGITDAGLQLKKYFPYQSDDKNELSDDISYGTNSK